MAKDIDANKTPLEIAQSISLSQLHNREFFLELPGPVALEVQCLYPDDPIIRGYMSEIRDKVSSEASGSLKPKESISYKDPSLLTIEEIRADEAYFSMEAMNDIDRAKYKNGLRARAKELGIFREVETLIGAWQREFNKNRKRYKADQAQAEAKIPLECNERGEPRQTIDNFLLVLDSDSYFDGLKFNELSYSPEHTVDGKLVRWTDADDSAARAYIEKQYGLYSLQKYEDAMRIKFKQNSYHPIRDIIESVEWDGVERIPTLLTKWLKCDDTPYTREVSRLIFAGGINRLYFNGCKFDNMPVLIGTHQGEGKSTFVRWLAIKDEFFREVSEIEGQKGIEAIEGGWICEMSELLALTRAKEVEAVKTYITKLVDTYRRPFDRRVTEHKRQCIFIGTTNKEQFLTDKTGNRRYYPIKVHQSGYDLFDHEEEAKADILQCWAEAKAKLDRGEMKPYADRNLLDEIIKAQRKATEEDYREGLIEDYLSNKKEICILELWRYALDNPEPSKPTKKDSNEISLIIQALGGWERAEKAKRIPGFGLQKYFVKSVTNFSQLEMKNLDQINPDNPFEL